MNNKSKSVFLTNSQWGSLLCLLSVHNNTQQIMSEAETEVLREVHSIIERDVFGDD